MVANDGGGSVHDNYGDDGCDLMMAVEKMTLMVVIMAVRGGGDSVGYDDSDGGAAMLC
jgi:hypothetical protein